MKKKLVIAAALIGLSVISIYGNSSAAQRNVQAVLTEHKGISYTDFISKVGKDKYIAQIKAKDQFILLADQVFNDDGKKLTMDAEVYLVKNDQVIELTSLSSCGTAYPIAWDGQGFYTAGGHGSSYYQLQNEELVMTEYAIEHFDEKGEASYEILKDGKKLKGTEKDFEEMFKRYLEAKPICFEE